MAKKKKTYPKCFKGKVKAKSLCGGEEDKYGEFKLKCKHCRAWRLF